jgi:hypothetical protein
MMQLQSRRTPTGRIRLCLGARQETDTRLNGVSFDINYLWG